MELKLVLVVLAVALLLDNPVNADFFFNHPLPKLGHLHHGMKCVPGRTIMKITEKQSQVITAGESDSEEFLRSGDMRRTHMLSPTKDEYCRMCVCSADGKDEYCSNRPAENINECLLLSEIMENHHAGVPYEHTKAITNRIRRANSASTHPAETKCVPFVSEYSTCNDDNMCTGCTKCTCTSQAQWSCQDVNLCDEVSNVEEDKLMDQDAIFDNALNLLEYEVSHKPTPVSKHPNVPDPPKLKEDNGLLGYLVAIPRQD